MSAALPDAPAAARALHGAVAERGFARTPGAEMAALPGPGLAEAAPEGGGG